MSLSFNNYGLYLLNECNQFKLIKASNSKDIGKICKDITEVDKLLPNGIISYVKEGKILLNNFINKINYYSSSVYSIPKGYSIKYGSELFINYEKCGEDNIGKCGFILVAGGLGERLHIKNIKISMPFSSANNHSYIELYCQYIKVFQQKSNNTIPFCIMTSEYTHDLFLSSKNYFGLNKNQFYIIKQSSVPCFSSIDGDLEYKNGFLLKPHGHGDIHYLLYKNRILEKWIEDGIENVIIFQDTNSLAFNSIYPLLGACIINNKDLMFLTTERFVGEKASIICSIEENKKEQFRAIDYCKLPGFTGENINNIKEGIISEFPAVTNIICFEINSYYKTLSETKGVLPNFVLPKIDKQNRLDSPVRLECVLQDYPILLSDTSKIDHLKMERWLVFNPVKELLNNNKLYSVENGFKLYNQKFIRCLEHFGCKIGENVTLYISPTTATSYDDYSKLFTKNIRINDNSTLQLYGKISMNRLCLDGKLMIKVKDGFIFKADFIKIEKNRNIVIYINKNVYLKNLHFL